MSTTEGRPALMRGFVLALLLLGVSGGQALAHRSPSNCNANRLTLSLDQNPAGNIVSGQTVVYTVGVFNPGPGTGIGCDVTGTTVTFTCPGADGTPSGQTTVLGTGLSFPADNSGDTIFPSVSCTIVVTPGVTSATARAQAGQNTGNRAADLTKGVLHDSAIDDPFVRINDLSLTVNTCVAKVDKQVSCDGGKTFHDVGLVSADDDGHADLCLGWNAFTVNGTAVPAEAIQVRYVVGNAGTADLLNCSIGEGNPGFPGTVSVGSLPGACVADVDCGNAQATCVNGACGFTSGANSAACSATLSAAEPDKATVTCDCTPTPGEVQATAFDEASFQCQTPGLTVMKDCALRDIDGNSAVTITVQNTGTADLENCTVTDTNFTDAACPASGDPTGTSSAVAVSPSTIASLAHGAAAPVTGTVSVTKDSCNTATVTCEIKGSVDPNNPGHQKTLTATAKDTCETCSVEVDKQIKWGAGPFIDVGFVSNNEDGTASCLGWNAFTVNGTSTAAEALTVQYVAKNTGGTGLFGCTVTDSNTAISSTAVSIGNVAQGGTSNPVPVNKTCSDTLDASEPDTASLSCVCTADLNSIFVTTAKDTASFDCQTPGLTVTKDCALRDTNGNSAVTITVKNTGTAELANCVVTDTNFTDAGCPASGNPSGTSGAVAVSPSTIASLAAGATAPSVTGTIAGLTQNSCNTTAVTCEIVGSVDPANPSARKKLTATAKDTCETCSVKVDKQIKCGAGPFIDVGFVTNNEDGTASCLGWNAFTVNGTSVAAEALTVQYVAQNTGGTALFSCTVTDSNAAISSTAVNIGDVASGGTSTPVPINKTCSDTLDAQEPDTATLSCFCTADVNPNFKATATDTASFACQTPGLTVTKDCALRDTNGNSAVTITVKNTGTAELAKCVVTDTNFTDAGCPASGSPSGTSSAVAVSTSTIASLGAGATAPSVTGTIAGLTQNSCNTVSVTCEIVGSVDPANPSARKKLTATAQDTCETCSVQVDKQIKCGAGPFIDVGFVTNNEDGTASCLGWNAFTVNGTSTAAEALTVQYVAQNTGGTALFGCTVTDSNTAISSTAVSIGNVAQGGTSNPVPINTTCSDTLDAQEPDTATLSCFCTADLNPNFKATAKDTASFDCQPPGMVVTKDGALRDVNGNR